MSFQTAITRNCFAAVGVAAAVGLAGATASVVAFDQPLQAADLQHTDMVAMCKPEVMTSVVQGMAAGISVKQVPNGPQLPGGVKFNPASGKVPGFCQVTGSYVTNAATGKTANFIATFPESWNGKYLQLGCSGACGYLMMNDPASPPIVVTAQGYPRQLIEKGYAIFGNDLGHVLPSPATSNFNWLRTSDGGLDQDSLADYLYRADQVMADMGKQFTRAVYERKTGSPAQIIKSYFSGCSQGGREALVAATRFSEKFDGIIAGSPLSDQTGILWKGLALGLLSQQTSPAKLSPGQIGRINDHILAQCDGLDGVKDGLIQNPAACGFRPARDLKICTPGEQGDSCVSEAQAKMIGVTLSASTDKAGQILQPGYPVGALSWSSVAPAPAGVKLDDDLRFLAGKPFDGQPFVTFGEGGAGPVRDFHPVVNAQAYRAYFAAIRAGSPQPEDFGALLKNGRKLLWYHNMADEALTPYMSISRYKQLAKLHGGYSKLQKNIRFFAIPASGHCGLGGDGPSNFDAIGALENWVEHGKEPNALVARTVDPASNLLTGSIDWAKPASRTMPLCTFPQMASYKGRGDVKDAANWVCRADDKRMLKTGPSGLQAGVL